MWFGAIAAAVVLGGLVAWMLLKASKERRINEEHKKINDDRIKQGLPPLSRKELGWDDEEF